MLMLFLLVIGGIYIGIFTPIEAGAIGAFGALIFTLLKGRLSWQNLSCALLDAGRTTCMIIMILAGVGILNYFLAATKIPTLLADFVSNLGASRYVVMLAIFIIYGILGCIMNIVPAILISLPMIYPTILAVGFDPIWFGVIMVI